MERVCIEGKKEGRERGETAAPWRRVWSSTTRPCRRLLLHLLPGQKPSKAFSRQTMLLHHVSHYPSTAFGCRKNPYLSLFNLHCGLRSSRPSLAAIDLAKRCCCAEGSRATVAALKWSKESLTSLSCARGKRMNDVGDANSFTCEHWRTSGGEEPEWKRKLLIAPLSGTREAARGSVYGRKKRVIIWGIFVRRRRWLPAHVWTLFWQQWARQKQSRWDLWG